MPRVKPYIKLDCDWRDDPKVMDFEDRHGKASLVDLVQLFCCMGEFYGKVDLRDNAQRLKLQRMVGKKGKALDAFLVKAAECGLVSSDGLSLGIVGSERAAKDGEVRRKRREYAETASAAAAGKRGGGR